MFVCLFVFPPVPLQIPASGDQIKFWSKVLAPVLASDYTILEIFNFNDFNFSVFFEALKLLSLGPKLHQKAIFFMFLYVGAPVR